MRKNVMLSFFLLVTFFKGYDLNIVFDQVGSYAGAVSFTHVAINADFSSIQVARSQARLALQNYDITLFRQMDNKLSDLQTPLRHHYIKQNQTYHRLSENRLKRLGQFEERLDNALRVLPDLRSRRDLSAADTVTAVVKPLLKQAARYALDSSHTNALGISTTMANLVSKGALVSFNSVFSPEQLFNIKQRISAMTSAFTSHDRRLKDVAVISQDLSTAAAYDNDLETIEAQSDFETLMDAMENSLDKVVNCLRELQDRHLSVDLLTADQLGDLFLRLQNIAQQKNAQLLISKPTDLFQLQASYIFDGNDIVVLLHVPMIPPNTLLRLLKLRPFPIPVTSEHSLMPNETPELLALSNSEPPQWNIVSQYSLIDCHKVNSIYVCPGNSVLRNNVKTHCLGALYMEDIQGAKALCDLDIIPEREQVLQLNDNNFLIYSTRDQDVSMSCPNIPNEIRKLHEGISVYKIPNTCALKLENTTVYSAFTLRLESQLKHYIWKDTSVQEFDIDEEDIEETKKNLPKSRHNRIHISEVVEHKRRWYSMKPFIQIATSAISTAVSVGVMAILTGILLFVKSRRNKDHCDTETKSLSERLDRLRTFAEEKLAMPPATEKINMRIPSPPTHNPSAYVQSKMNLNPPRAH